MAPSLPSKKKKGEGDGAFTTACPPTTSLAPRKATNERTKKTGHVASCGRYFWVALFESGWGDGQGAAGAAVVRVLYSLAGTWYGA